MPSFIYLCLIVSFYKLYVFHTVVVNKVLAESGFLLNLRNEVARRFLTRIEIIP